MESLNLIESFQDFKEVKSIDKAILMNILEDVFKSVLTKKFGTADNFDIIVNPDKGDLEIMRNRQIVDDEFAEDSFDYNENIHISLSDAQKIDSSFELKSKSKAEIQYKLIEALGWRIRDRINILITFKKQKVDKFYQNNSKKTYLC